MTRRIAVIAGLVAIGAVIAATALLDTSDGSSTTCNPGAVGPRAGGVSGPAASFDHVVVILFENKHYEQVIGSDDAPTFNRLARRYGLLSNYCGVAHPSLPNYIALASGSTQGITSDCTDCTVDAPNLADTLGRAHRTWKVYAEGLPSVGFTGAGADYYRKKHEPFVYFRSVYANPSRLKRIVGLDRLAGDIAAKRLADYTFIAPNMCNSMHDCPVATGDAWLARYMPRLLAAPQLRHAAIFVVFDESDRGTTGGGGHVPALVVGPAVKPHSRTSAQLSHYSLLRTIEDTWHLARLGKSRTAAPIRGIWR